MIKTGVVNRDNSRSAQDALISAGYRIHHTGTRRGYVSRKTAGTLGPYSGRFGTGYIWIVPRWDTSQYISVEYWIK